MPASLERVTVFDCKVNVIDHTLSGSLIEQAVAEAKQYKNNLLAKREQQCIEAMSNSRPLLSNLFVPNIIDHLPVIREVASEIQKYVDHYANELSGGVYRKSQLTRSWLAFQPSRAYVKKHNHLFHVFDSSNASGVDITHINAVLYLQAERDLDKLSVYYPCQSISITSPRSNAKQEGNHQSPSVFTMVAGHVPCIANRLVLIPSWLEHSVDPRERADDKICLSANYIFKNE